MSEADPGSRPGDTAHAAWVAIQDRAERLYEGRTQSEVADLLGKKRNWVAVVLAWGCIPGTTPFGGKTAEQKGRGTKEAAKVIATAPIEEVEKWGNRTPSTVAVRPRRSGPTRRDRLPRSRPGVSVPVSGNGGRDCVANAARPRALPVPSASSGPA